MLSIIWDYFLGLRSKMKHKSFFLNHLQNRIKRNGNALIGIVGDTGSGKSYFAMNIAESIDPKFNVSNITFTPSSFLEKVKTCKPNQVIIMDDAGLTIPARQFYSMSNQFISTALETCRFKNQILIMTMPTLSMIDKNARRLMNYVFWMKSIDRTRQTSTATMYFISTNPIQDKIYYKHPVKDNAVFESLTVHMPSETLLNSYELYKGKFLNSAYGEMVSKLHQIEKKKEHKKHEKDNMDLIIKSLKSQGLSNKKIGESVGLSYEGVRQRLKKQNGDKNE